MSATALNASKSVIITNIYFVSNDIQCRNDEQEGPTSFWEKKLG